MGISEVNSEVNFNMCLEQPALKGKRLEVINAKMAEM